MAALISLEDLCLSAPWQRRDAFTRSTWTLTAEELRAFSTSKTLQEQVDVLHLVDHRHGKFSFARALLRQCSRPRCSNLTDVHEK